jgi:hypothetical protein
MSCEDAEEGNRLYEGLGGKWEEHIKIDLRELGCAVIRQSYFGISSTEPFCSATRDNNDGSDDDDDKSEHPSTINWYREAPLGAQTSIPVSYPGVEFLVLAPVGYVTRCAFLYMLEKRQIPLLLTEIKSGRSVSIPSLTYPD